MTRPILPQTVKRTGAGTYHVSSATVAGRTYYVDLTANSCQCQGFRHRGDCSHLTLAKERCRQVTAEKARLIPDVTIDELACKYEEAGRSDIATALYAEIRRRTSQPLTEAVGVLSGLTEVQRKAIRA